MTVWGRLRAHGIFTQRMVLHHTKKEEIPLYVKNNLIAEVQDLQQQIYWRK